MREKMLHYDYFVGASGGVMFRMLVYKAIVSEFDCPMIAHTSGLMLYLTYA